MQDEWGLGHYGSVSYTTLLPPNIFSIFHCKKAKACPLCIHKAGNIKIKLTLYSIILMVLNISFYLDHMVK